MLQPILQKASIATLLILTVCTATTAREWTDNSGRFRIEAKLIRQTATSVVLQEPDGRKLMVPVANLSRADQQYLNSLSKPEPAKTPPRPTAPKSANIDTADATLTAAPLASSTLVRGMEIISHDASGRGIVGSLAVPAEWPEQKVTTGEVRKSAAVKRVSYKQLSGGSKLMLLTVPTLRSRSTAKIEVDFKVTRIPQKAPADPSSLKAPANPAGQLRAYLASSPGINLRHPRVTAIASELAATGAKDWKLARSTYDWVRKNLKYTRGDLRGAVWAAEHGKGDCEEYTSLFIALSRANGIPARVVWVPGHCYPEFYLEDAKGAGQWFPCDPLSADAFGTSTSLKPILQKGDNFPDPGKTGTRRYLAETIQGSINSGGRQPEVKAILRIEK